MSNLGKATPVTPVDFNEKVKRLMAEKDARKAETPVKEKAPMGARWSRRSY